VACCRWQQRGDRLRSACLAKREQRRLKKCRQPSDNRVRTGVQSRRDIATPNRRKQQLKASNRYITQIVCAHALAIGLLIAPAAGAQPELDQKPDTGSGATESNPVRSERGAGQSTEETSQTPRETASGMPTPDDAATGSAGPDAARAIEKKDIRRGMVIAKPGSITPHTRMTSDGTPTSTLPAQPQEISIDTNSSYPRTKPNDTTR
jgi:hypothetical protein